MPVNSLGQTVLPRQRKTQGSRFVHTATDSVKWENSITDWSCLPKKHQRSAENSFLNEDLHRSLNPPQGSAISKT